MMSTGLKVSSRILPIIFALMLLGCASHVYRKTAPLQVLTHKQLLQINNDNLFTRFYYSDGKTFSGILLRWLPDSIYIQPRGSGSPLPIPSSGLAQIQTVTGNKMFSGLVFGTIAAGIYFTAVQGYKLQGISFESAMIKLLVPPAIILTAMGIGASKEVYETYTVPAGFTFDYGSAKERALEDK